MKSCAASRVAESARFLNAETAGDKAVNGESRSPLPVLAGPRRGPIALMTQSEILHRVLTCLKPIGRHGGVDRLR